MRDSNLVPVIPCPLNIQTLLFQAERDLAQAGCKRPAFEARYLLEEVLRVNRAWLILHGDRQVNSDDKKAYRAMVEQRKQGLPLQYIARKTHFWSRDFVLTPDVLIPRPETEFVVEQALVSIRAAWPNFEEIQVLDLGTGSGVIADILAEELGCTVVGTDISWPALLVARRNIQAHGLSGQVSLVCADMFSAFAPGATFHAIVANLPYVETEVREKLDREVVEYEPALALFAGPDGLDCYRRCIAEAGGYLYDGGVLILEIGAAQDKAIAQLLARHGFVSIEIRHDYAGLPRCACACKA